MWETMEDLTWLYGIGIQQLVVFFFPLNYLLFKKWLVHVQTEETVEITVIWSAAETSRKSMDFEYWVNNERNKKTPFSAVHPLGLKK